MSQTIPQSWNATKATTATAVATSAVIGNKVWNSPLNQIGVMGVWCRSCYDDEQCYGNCYDYDVRRIYCLLCLKQAETHF